MVPGKIFGTLWFLVCLWSCLAFNVSQSKKNCLLFVICGSRYYWRYIFIRNFINNPLITMVSIFSYYLLRYKFCVLQIISNNSGVNVEIRI